MGLRVVLNDKVKRTADTFKYDVLEIDCAVISKKSLRQFTKDSTVKGLLDNDLLNDKVMGHTVTGWREIDDEDGTPIPFSEGIKIQIIDALPGFIYKALLQFILGLADIKKDDSSPQT